MKEEKKKRKTISTITIDRSYNIIAQKQVSTEFTCISCVCVCYHIYICTQISYIKKKIMYVQAILLDFTVCEFTFIILYSCMVFLPKFIIHI